MVIFITLSCSEKNSYFLGQAYPKCSIVYDVFSGIGALQTVHGWVWCIGRGGPWEGIAVWPLASYSISFSIFQLYMRIIMVPTLLNKLIF